MGTDSTGEFDFDPRGADGIELGVIGDRNDAEVAAAEDPTANSADDPKAFNPDHPRTSLVPDVEPTSRLTSRSCPNVTEGSIVVTDRSCVLMPTTGLDDLNATDVLIAPSGAIDRAANPEDPGLPPGKADASLSLFPSSLFSSRVSSVARDDENIVDEVEQTKKAASTHREKVRPDPPGSSLSKKESLKRLREKYRILEDIELVVPSSVDRAEAAPPAYMILFEKYLDHCLLWFPLPGFLMRFLAIHATCLAQINLRGIRHLLGIYVLSRECGVDISTDHLSYLTKFRDDHFEDRFFLVDISEKTVNADCIDLVKTRWERQVKPSLPEVSKKFVKAMHKELYSGNGNWKESFRRKRIKRAFSAEIILGKILGRGRARVSFREQAALEAAAKAARSSGTDTLRAAASSRSFVEFRRMSAERARISRGKGKGTNREPPSKKRRVDTSLTTIVDKEASASGVALPLVSGLLRDEAYAATKSKAPELSLLFDRLVGDYNDDVRFRDSELRVARVANAAVQSRLDELTERNLVLERDAFSVQKIKKDYDAKLAKLKLKCSKADEEIASLKTLLSSASDLQSSRIGEAVAAARGEMTRGFAGPVSEVARLLVEIGGKVQNNMLNLVEIDANLEFIGLLRGSSPPDLASEIRAFEEKRRPIYDARDVFGELLDRVHEVLEIPRFPPLMRLTTWQTMRPTMRLMKSFVR
ncbi:hypothetical protein AALP_AAs44880U000200 [Arabis alpina]|uniref:Uncharacterized protein n=1 Tax=Arabis alpina TaxID=50452 RepID=A0A087G235_ARAAL|nr:hypothetical protein AALP_AAs44880U000200 [Arabis alpina]